MFWPGHVGNLIQRFTVLGLVLVPRRAPQPLNSRLESGKATSRGDDEIHRKTHFIQQWHLLSIYKAYRRGCSAAYALRNLKGASHIDLSQKHSEIRSEEWSFEIAKLGYSAIKHPGLFLLLLALCLRICCLKITSKEMANSTHWVEVDIETWVFGRSSILHFYYSNLSEDWCLSVAAAWFWVISGGRS